MLLAAGEAGRRAALPSTSIMIRQPMQRFTQMQARRGLAAGGWGAPGCCLAPLAHAALAARGAASGERQRLRGACGAQCGARPEGTHALRAPSPQASDIDIYRTELRKTNAEVVRLLAKHTGHSEAEVAADIARPKYFNPYEAGERAPERVGQGGLERAGCLGDRAPQALQPLGDQPCEDRFHRTSLPAPPRACGWRVGVVPLHESALCGLPGAERISGIFGCRAPPVPTPQQSTAACWTRVPCLASTQHPSCRPLNPPPPVDCGIVERALEPPASRGTTNTTASTSACHVPLLSCPQSTTPSSNRLVDPPASKCGHTNTWHARPLCPPPASRLRHHRPRARAGGRGGAARGAPAAARVSGRANARRPPGRPGVARRRPARGCVARALRSARAAAHMAAPAAAGSRSSCLQRLRSHAWRRCCSSSA